ncbi:HAD-IA family hydrolase [Patulibacter sp.]|uniref:HAD-IA family hydrolase n=1 Tax=Patulibacter sp. TaxID=1912859 RepID=UPI00271D7FC1|nr:HAD-IA family hydrolase [Patulibacter sp.]MDO9408684.1 HAD-IA family hydrolase [Patulibacter sp.]
MRAILSDLDGTLVDSTPAVLRVWQGWMRDRDLPVLPAEKHPHGIPARSIVATLAPHLDADAEADELERREIADLEGVRALPGADVLLRVAAAEDAGAATAGWPLVAVVTSCTRPLALARIRAAGLPVPAVLITAERTARVKPDPDPYLLGARELGVDPADCLVLEDAPAGIAAGRAAGMRVVAVRCSHDGDALRDADEVVDDVSAFLRGADLP